MYVKTFSNDAQVFIDNPSQIHYTTYQDVPSGVWHSDAYILDQVNDKVHLIRGTGDTMVFSDTHLNSILKKLGVVQ